MKHDASTESDGSDATREVVWRGLDDDSRLDVVSVDFADAGGLVATGTQSTEEYRARWDVAVDSAWHTRLLTVDVESAQHDDGIPRWQRHLNLWRTTNEDGSSRWRSEGGESGVIPDDFGDIGITPGAETLFEDAVDIDLSGCPLTNTMPIRRFDRLPQGTLDRPITTAWVSLPDLAVRPAAQVYAPAAEGLVDIAAAFDEDVDAVVHYHSVTRGVSVDLSVDADGLVLTYPDLSARVRIV